MAVTRIALSDRPHDRVAHRRIDEDWIAARWAEPQTRVLVVSGGRLKTSDAGLEWLPADRAPAGVKVLLGERDGAVRFAVITESDGPGWRSLRGLAALIDGEDGVFAVHAVGIAEWLARTKHCSGCGGRLLIEQAGHLARCAGCGSEQFPRTDPAVIMIVVDGERCLLGRHPSWPAGRFSTLAGFVEPGESLESAVRREVREESGITVGRVDYFGSQPWPMPASLMVGFVAHAESSQIVVDGQEIEDARWFTRTEMLAKAQSGELVLPGGISISRSLIEHWYGAQLPGQW
ncbi:MAG TPA: NAD(+) diphosphatase [Marmoricola sp.]|nr:NAD(+) diphosphatase [Nocardioidaceae bacterium]MCO5324157.1 NAD(+) diphosphatase [Nocardioidaceae bacterium]HRV69465.1 NAD(+) diphosphatase [Marmoricola sp.]